ncbi:HNH endonuclease [Kribbella sp. NBC_00662]|uniref:HNH endonuclease signature motif containing protein n=1 Tax=Kribbella sp. NBC_00662 TaxID=2975969 RepID=UPI00325156EA
MEVLGERPVWSMSDSEKLSALDAVVAEKARLETLELHLIAAIDQSGYATDLGAGDTARLLTHRYRTDATEARRQVRIATNLTKYAATTAALPDPSTPFTGPATAHPAEVDDPNEAVDEVRDGGTPGWRVSPAQAAAIVSVLNQVPATVPAEDLEFAEHQLIDLAATHTPTELRRAGRKIRDILDPDGPEPDEKAAYERESLTLKTVDRGVTFRGYLANENAELLRTLIHAHARPHKTIDGQLDPRPRDKRQADALTTILATATNTAPTASRSRAGTATSPEHNHAVAPEPVLPALDGAVGSADDADVGNATEAANSADSVDSAGDNLVPGHGPKPHISITIDYNDLTAATANATGQLIFGDNLSAATVRRLACDAQILPMILGSKSQPLDVGTTQRLVTRPMRRALNARDKGCVICNAPPIQCEAHHIISWLDGGPTAINNLALLCKRHHLDLHSGHWHIRILNGTVHVTRPTWANPTPIPPTKYKPPTADVVHHPPTPPPTPWSDGQPTTPTTDPPTPTAPPHPDDFDPWGDIESATRTTADADARASAAPAPCDARDNACSRGERPHLAPWADHAAG